MLKRAAHGFTLLEVLIASVLVGVVLTLAMTGFIQIRKVTNLAQSRLTAGEEAAKGIQEVGSLLKRAHVIFFTARPLLGTGAATNGEDASKYSEANTNAARAADTDVPVARIPAIFQTGQGNRFVNYNFGDPVDMTAVWGLQVDRTMFRFCDTAEGGIFMNGANGQRLRTNNPDAGDDPYDRFFPSPLAYWAEATFHEGGLAAGVNRDAQLPETWDFYLLYLAPMQARPNDAFLSYADTGYEVDRVERPGANPDPPTWDRSAIPFELRLLKIPGVPAARPTEELQVDPSGRTGEHVLGVPFDYEAGSVNYDPVPIAMQPAAPPTDSAAGFLDSDYIWVPDPSSTAVARVAGSGERVEGGGVHPNFNNIGNDPPTQAAFANRSDAVPITDKVLARYIDPDSVHGTCVRLLNSIDVSPTNVALPGYHRYLNAYIGDPSPTIGFQGFLYNTYSSVMPGWNRDGQAPVPRRALVSVTTRYRADRQLPFQFHTERIEIDLENVVSYQSIQRRTR